MFHPHFRLLIAGGYVAGSNIDGGSGQYQPQQGDASSSEESGTRQQFGLLL